MIPISRVINISQTTETKVQHEDSEIERDNQDVQQGKEMKQDEFHPVNSGYAVDSPPQPASDVTIMIERDLAFISRANTVLSLMTGEKYATMFAKYVWRVKYMYYVISCLWVLSLIIGMVTLVARDIHLPAVIYVVQILFSVALAACFFADANLIVLRQLFQTFSFWYLNYHVIVGSILMCALWDWELPGIAFSIQSFANLFMFSIYDSYSPKFKSKMYKFISFGFVSIFLIIFIIRTPFIYDWDDKNQLLFRNIIIVDYRLQVSESYGVVSIFLLRIVWSFYWKKNPFAMVFLEDFYRIQDKTTPKKLMGRKTTLARIDKMRSESSIRLDTRIFSGLSSGSLRQARMQVALKNIAHANARMISPEDHERNQQFQKMLERIMANPHKFFGIGIMRSSTIKIHHNNTIYHKFIKGRYVLLEKLLKSKIYTTVGYILSVVAAFIQYLELVGNIEGQAFPIILTFISCLAFLFVTLQLVISSNILIVRRSLRSFDFWYVMWLSIQILVYGSLISGWEVSIQCWIITFVGMVWILFIDAFPKSHRKLGFLVGPVTLWFLVTGTLCKARIGRIFQRSPTITMNGVHIIDASQGLSSTAFSSALFCARFLASFIRDHNRVLFFTTKLEMKPMDVLLTDGTFADP